MELLSIAIVLIVLSILAYVAGLRGLAGFTMGIARLLIFVFLVIFVASLLLN